SRFPTRLYAARAFGLRIKLPDSKDANRPRNVRPHARWPELEEPRPSSSRVRSRTGERADSGTRSVADQDQLLRIRAEVGLETHEVDAARPARGVQLHLVSARLLSLVREDPDDRASRVVHPERDVSRLREF